ncbi:hypothetical protein BTM25_01250 [Actinomadura rubteroloni]|uniref:Uncharacterized protein n=2 Tax=Actinomadura rubteroloni TaxID=1926885 RepID=A0A2P4UL26_9ACTN|nr:hypothetical protein BTM25_01250 [Actinomadura rubteroloni]
MADPLLPPALESARAAVPILDSLPAPGYATPRAPQRVRAMRSVENIYNLSGVLGHVGTGPAEAWIATDKTFPHALYEVMVMSAGTGVRPGLHDHSEAYAASVGAMGAVFAEHCANWELSPVISWSYDPATVDRESIQGEKRLHTHFIGRTAEEVDMVRARSTPVGQSAPGRQRRIVEEASVLAGVLVADCLDPSTLKALEPVAPLSSAASTATIQLRMRDGWDSLADPGLAEDLTRIHAVLRTIYDRIGAACLTGETGPWRRPALDPVGVERVDLPLSDRSREALGHYLGGMRPQLLTDVEALRNPSNRDRTTHIYPLADLAYSVCLSAHQGQVYTHVRVNVFSDLGGAGMSVLDGTVVKTRKGERTMTPEDEAHRLDFQRGYLDRVRHHAYGGHALFPLAQPSLDPRTARIGPGPTTRSPGEQVQAEGQAGTRLLAMTRRPARVAREERSPQASGSPSPPPSPSADTSSGPEL